MRVARLCHALHRESIAHLHLHCHAHCRCHARCVNQTWGKGASLRPARKWHGVMRGFPVHPGSCPFQSGKVDANFITAMVAALTLVAALSVVADLVAAFALVTAYILTAAPVIALAVITALVAVAIVAVLCVSVDVFMSASLRMGQTAELRLLRLSAAEVT